MCPFSYYSKTPINNCLALDTVVDRWWTTVGGSSSSVRKQACPLPALGNAAVLPGFCSYEKLYYVSKSTLVMERSIKRKPEHCPLVMNGAQFSAPGSLVASEIRPLAKNWIHAFVVLSGHSISRDLSMSPRHQQEPTKDPVILNALLHVCKTMHDSVK